MSQVAGHGEPRIVRLGEAARLAGVCTRTIRRWVARGLLSPAETTAGGERRYDRDSVLALTRKTVRRTRIRRRRTTCVASPPMWEGLL
jgi:predicted site-specific integrase-resolvase